MRLFRRQDNETKRYDLTKGYHHKRKYLTDSERDDYRTQGWDVTLSDEVPGVGVLVYDMEQRYLNSLSKGKVTQPHLTKWNNHLGLGMKKKSAGGRKTGNPYDLDRIIKIKVNQYDSDGRRVGRKFFIVRQGDFVQKESVSV